jgi:hypothetical protein
MPELYMVRSVIICDDIRREDNGKEILIGVYAGSIIFRSVPVRLATFGIRLEVLGSKARYNETGLQVIAPSGEVLYQTMVEIDVADASLPASVPFKVQGAIFKEVGEYKIMFRLEGDFQQVYTFIVKTVAADAPKAT